jgi:glucoamylase
LPDGPVFTDGWCRPQNDGPGLRAIALMIFANSQGLDSDVVKNQLWTNDNSVYNGGAIKHDLDWIVDGWDSNTCDLWEEVQSSDFFWNRVTMKKALLDGADFASSMGDSSSASSYLTTAANINATLLSGHWESSDEYVYESTNRLKDGAVIVGFNDGFSVKDNLFAPTSFEVAATIKNYNVEFCHEWNINSIDTANDLPGVLYGRYPGDTYDGGNPWVLSTSALANLFYRGAIELSTTGSLPSSAAQSAWSEVFYGDGVSDAFPSNVTAASDLFLRAGDGVLLRLRSHVESDGFHLDEQIDRETGVQESAKDLTWSYAETLSAMASRYAYMSL